LEVAPVKSTILGSKKVRPVGPRFYQTVVDIKIEQEGLLSSSCIIDDGEDFVVAFIYPIQDITPRIPPTIFKIDNCKTIGLHSDNNRRYEYTKNADMARTNTIIP